MTHPTPATETDHTAQTLIDPADPIEGSGSTGSDHADGDNGSAAAAAAAVSDTTAFPAFTVDLFGPSAPSWRSARGILRSGWRIATLSTRSQALPRPVLPAAVALWAAVVGFGCALILTWLAAAGSGDTSAATVLWLAAHHAPFSTAGGDVTLLPLGLMLITLLPARRAGRYIVCHVPARHVNGVGGVSAACYVTIVALVAGVQHSEGPDVPIWRAAFWAAVVAFVGGSWGVIRQLRGRLTVPAPMAALAVCVGVPLVVASVLTLGVLATNAGAIYEAQQAVAQSGMEQVGIVLLQLAYLPNFIVWAAAFVVGTGFNVGVGQVVSPFTSAQPALPDLPVLVAIPTGSPSWSALLPISVAIGGALGAILFARRAPEPRLGRRVARVAMLSLSAGVGWFVLSFLAGGALGDGRLEHMGPAAGTAFIATLLTAAGGLLWALLPTMASDARPVAADLRSRVSSRAKTPMAAGGRE